jgi:hypothetical protein
MKAIWLALLVLLVACVPSTQTKTRPPGSPDVVILAFAGRCASIPVLTPEPCNPPFDNTAYLGERGTTKLLADTFKQMGHSVATFDVSSYLFEHSTKLSKEPQKGYLEAQNYLSSVVQNWVEGYSNPTRIVILSHSHGTVWASLLAWNNPKVRFDYLIYLDAICLAWPQDHMLNTQFFQSRFDAAGLRRPWPLNQNEGATPCAAAEVTGMGKKDINDVVPNNVSYALEVLSKNLTSGNVLMDDDLNHRPDGSRKNIWSIKSGVDNHSEVSDIKSSSMRWVVEAVKLLGLPGEAVPPDLVKRLPAGGQFGYR